MDSPWHSVSRKLKAIVATANKPLFESNSFSQRFRHPFQNKRQYCSSALDFRSIITSMLRRFRKALAYRTAQKPVCCMEKI